MNNTPIDPQTSAADAIPALRSSGKFVLVTYDGMTYASHTAHDTQAEAKDDMARIALRNQPGERTQLLEPLLISDENEADPIDAPEPNVIALRKPAAKKAAASIAA